MSLFIRSALWSALFFIFIGCASQFENLHSDDDFDRSGLTKDNYLIGGLSLGTETRYSKKTRFALNEEMWFQFKSVAQKINHPSIPKLSTAYFIGKLGQTEYLKMLQEFDEETKLSLKTCQKIQAEFPELEYIIFSRLEEQDYKKHHVGLSYYVVDIKTTDNVWKASMQTSWKDSYPDRGPAGIDVTRSQNTKNLIKNSFEFFAQKFYR